MLRRLPTWRCIGMARAAYRILVDPEWNLLDAHTLSDDVAGLIHSIRLAMLNGISAGEFGRHSVMPL